MIRRLLAPFYHRIRYSLTYFFNETSLEAFFPRGHYYSPLPNIEMGARIAEEAARIDVREGLPGIAISPADQQQRLRLFQTFEQEFDWPRSPVNNRRYFVEQGFFNETDAFTLYSIMKATRPRRIIEIGSGFSSALMLDARDTKFDFSFDLTFVEPFPERLNMLLKEGDNAKTTLHTARVQDLPLKLFSGLAENDILFVDSSHVSSVGSDVNHILFEILPRLQRGVMIHFHDVFWPFEYPAQWIRKGLAWNEAYLLRAFLTLNSAFEIYFWAPYAAALGDKNEASKIPFEKGQSIWIRRT